ncbi:hypothetical protein BpHYR1_004589 [Brachionus plicatilis]|uniref:Uncharacterized protein n=1 Tax=Brachionus plicatilis TaxID=10195 RepID=A0A3M7PB58_BRAPC|nr:hypothetical protein BpHYR1_004589 [Brachionus plicatilis]
MHHRIWAMCLIICLFDYIHLYDHGFIYMSVDQMIPSNDGIENIEPVLVKNKELMNTPENYYYKIKRVKSVRSKNDTMAQAGDLLKKLKNSVIETISGQDNSTIVAVTEASTTVATTVSVETTTLNSEPVLNTTAPVEPTTTPIPAETNPPAVNETEVTTTTIAPATTSKILDNITTQPASEPANNATIA